MSMVGSGAIMVGSLGSMMKILFISIAGVISAKHPVSDPILPVSALKGLARLNNMTLLPCLIVYSLGATLSPELLAKIGILILFCAANYGLSYIVALTVGRFLHEKDNEELFSAVLVAICNPNAVALPILLMQGICQNPIVNQDFGSDASACANLATSMIFVYITGWFIMFWGFSFPLLQKPIVAHVVKESVSSSSNSYFSHFLKLIPTLKQMFLSPSMIAIYIGMFIGLVTPLQQLIFTKPTPGLPFGDSINVIGNPVVCLNCIIMAASLAHCDYSPIIQFFTDNIIINKLKGHNSDNQHALVPAGEEVANPLDIELSSKSKNVEKIVVKSGTSQIEEKATLPHARSVVALIVCRLFLCPFLSLLFVKICLGIGILNPKTDRLMSIFIVIQGSTPPAQVLITTLNQLGYGKIASSLSYMFIFVYSLSILTVTMWVTISMVMVYE